MYQTLALVRKIKYLVKKLYRYRLLTLTILLFGISTAVPRVIAQVPTSTPMVQRQKNTSWLLREGKVLYNAGQYKQAAKVLQQAADAFATQGDKLNQAAALSNLSLTYQQLGRWQEAKEAITNSLNILQTHKSTAERSRILAFTLDIQGQLQLGIGQAQLALETWQKAAKIYTQIGNRSGITHSQINQAQAMQALGFYPRACKTLLTALGVDNQECQLSEEAFQTVQKQPHTLSKLDSLRSLGKVLRVMGEKKKSQEVLAESLNVAKNLQKAEKLPYSQEIAAVYLSLGNTYVALGKREIQLKKLDKPPQITLTPPRECKSEVENGNTDQLYQQAANCYLQAASSPSPTTRIQARLNLLHLLLQTHQWSEVPTLRSEIEADLKNNLPVSSTGVFARLNLAQSLMCLKSALSPKQLQVSSPILQGCSLPTEKAQSTEGNTIQASQVPTWEEIEQIVKIALEQAQKLEDKRAEAHTLGYLGGIYQQMGDLGKAQEFTKQALELADARNAPDIAYRWQWQLGRLYQNQREQAISAYSAAFANLKLLRKDLVAINPEIQFTFRDSVEPIYREFVDLLLQPSLTKGIGKQKVSQKNLKLAREAIEALQLAELDNFFREACVDAKPKQIDTLVDEKSPQTAVFYAIILKNRLEVIVKLPGQEELEHYTATIPQEGEPEEILAELKKYLSDNEETQNVRKFSRKVYNWLIQPAESKLETSDVKTLVFVLDGSLRNIPMAVLYDGQKYLIEKYAIALSPGLQLLNPRPRVHLNALLGGISEKPNLEGDLPALKYVEDELKAIQSTVYSTKPLLNQEFIETNLKQKLKNNKFTVVHMATHGRFSSNLEKTFILLWKHRFQVKELQKLLRTGDPTQSTPIELLVLSACETATGDDRAILGLAGIAVKAGARSTLATLWRVDDELTAIFMKKFYEELTKDPKITKAQALQKAQIFILREIKGLPYRWAPYILVGNWL